MFKAFLNAYNFQTANFRFGHIFLIFGLLKFVKIKIGFNKRNVKDSLPDFVFQFYFCGCV